MVEWLLTRARARDGVVNQVGAGRPVLGLLRSRALDLRGFTAIFSITIERGIISDKPSIEIHFA